MITKKYKNITVIFHCKECELKETHIIYLLKFPNKKFYVGQTNNKMGLISRIQSHCYESYNKNKKRNKYKDNIIKKYKTFDVFILKKCNINNIDEFEIFYINILKNKIVNLESGGSTNKIVSEETKKKISEKNKKYYLKNPIYNKINVYDLKGNFVRSHFSISEIKNFYNVSSIIVDNALYKNDRLFLKKYQIFREGTEKIKDYTNVIKVKKNKIKRLPKNPAELAFKYDSKSGMFIEEVEIGKMDSNRRYFLKKSIKNNSLFEGFAWLLEKKDKIVPPKSRYEKVSEKLSKPILQLDNNLNIIKRWNSITEAKKSFNKEKEDLIRQVCIRWRRHAYGYSWCFENEYEWYKSMWGKKLVRKR